MYQLGRKSLRELEGVHPDLVAVVQRAIEITEQDFTVFDGFRTEAEQRQNIRNGVSWTMKSKHLPQASAGGMVTAVDLVPWIEGRPVWSWLHIYIIAEAMRQAAQELGVRLRWGGTWARFDNTTLKPKTLVRKYVNARLEANKKARIDGPHYEILL